MGAWFIGITLVCCVVIMESSVMGEMPPTPIFREEHSEVTVVAGRDAVLPCHVRNQQDYKTFEIRIYAKMMFVSDPRILAQSGQYFETPTSTLQLYYQIQVVWMNADRTVLTLEHVTMVQNRRISVQTPHEGDWNLHVRHVTVEDEGTYSCELTTSPRQKKLIKLVVKVPPRIIDSESSSDVVVREFDTVELMCKATGVPTPTITWHKDSKTKDNSEEDWNYPEDELLRIRNITRWSGGVYICTADNGVPPAVSREMHVTVHHAPVVKEPRPRIGQQKGKGTILECIVTSNPRSKIKWFKNGTEILGGSRYRLDRYAESVDRGSSSLQILNLNDGDFGEYVCEAENIIGKDRGVSMLYEYIPPGTRLETATEMTTTTVGTPAEDNENNEMLSRVKHISVTVDTNVTFQCRVPGWFNGLIWVKGEHTVTIAIGGILMSFDERYEIKRTSPDTSSFLIHNVQDRDTGQYRALYKKDGSTFEPCVFNLTVSEKAIENDKEVPEVKHIPATVDSHVTFQCKVPGWFDGLIWAKGRFNVPIAVGDELFIQDNRYEIKRPSPDTYNFLIRNVRKSDDGKYLTLYKKDGQRMEACVFNLTVSGEDPDMESVEPSLQISEPKIVERGERINIQCNATVEYYQSDAIEWFKNGQRITSKDYERIGITHQYSSGTLISNVMIDEASMEDGGTYVCRTMDMQIASVKVSIDDENAIQVQHISATPDSRVTFECQVPGWYNGLEWLKDGDEASLAVGIFLLNQDHGYGLGQISEDTYAFYIDPAKVTDGGIYRARQTRDDPDSVVCVYNLTVSEKVNKERVKHLGRITDIPQAIREATYHKNSNPLVSGFESTQRSMGRLTEAPGAAPRNVRAISASPQTIFIEWDEPELPNGNILGYKVFYTTTPELPAVLWDSEMHTVDHMATITNLIPDTTYTISMLAFNRIGYGPLSQYIHVFTRQTDDENAIQVQHISATLDSHVTFKCQVPGWYNGLEWLKDGDEAPLAVGIYLLYQDRGYGLRQLSEDTYAFYIDPAKVTDGGIYRARQTRDDPDSVVCIYNLTVSEKESSQVTVTPTMVISGTRLVKKGGEIVLVCVSVGDNLQDEIDWFKDGRKLRSNNDVHIKDEAPESSPTKSSTLQIGNARMSDGGTYVCRSSTLSIASINVQVEDVTTIHPSPLSTAAPPSLPLSKHFPRITDYSGDVSARVGNDVTLWCKTNVYPLPPITWYKLPTDPTKTKTVFETKKDVIVIRNAARPHDGEYECRISSGKNTNSRHMKLTVEYPPEVQIEHVFNDDRLPVGIDCQIEAQPLQYYTLTRNGIRIHSGDKYTVSECRNDDDSLTYSLRVSNPPVESGTFGCEAINQHGSSRTIATLPESEQRPDSGVTNVTVTEGLRAVLPCSFDNRGYQKVVWINEQSTVLTIDDRRVIDDQRVSIERPYARDWNLHIREVTFSDSGLYTCQMNTVPVTLKTIRLIVKVPPKILASEFSGDIEVKELDTIKLPCKATGEPQPTITWFKRSKTAASPINNLNKEGDTLVLQNVTTLDSGEYMCVADNGVPPLSVSRQIKITVHASDKGPIFDLSVTSVTVVEGDTAVLPCAIDNLGSFRTVWIDRWSTLLTFGERRIIDDDRISVERPYTRDWNLHIRRVVYNDRGPYTCQVNTNPVRTKTVMLIVKVTSTSATVKTSAMPSPTSTTVMPASTVKPTTQEPFGGGPSFDVSPINVTVSRGITAILPCAVDNLGTNMIIWMNPRRILMTTFDRGHIDDPRISIDRPYERDWNILIRNVTHRDQGSYMCQINTKPIQIKTVTLIVQDDVKLSLHPTDAFVIQNSPFKFTCKVEGNVTGFTFRWERNGRQLGKGRQRYTVISKENESTLKIKDVRRKDNASFVCIGRIGEDEMNATTSLTVVKDSDLTHGSKPGLPQFTVSPLLNTVEIGRTAVLTCEAKGLPSDGPLRLRWIKNDDEIVTDDVQTVHREQGSHIASTLTIHNAKGTDQASYRCLAQNSVGVSASTNAIMYVGVRRIRPLFTVVPPVSMSVKPGTNLTLECIAVGSPIPLVKWEPKGDASPHKDVLQLYDIQETQSFTCVAESVLGINTHNTTVTLDNF